jgi:hypothetical protein
VQAVRGSVPIDRNVHAQEAPTETVAYRGRTAGIKLISVARSQYVNGSFGLDLYDACPDAPVARAHVRGRGQAPYKSKQ